MSSTFFANKKILVIAPHPDDEVIGCGATILKAVQQGAQVFLLVVSVGDLVRIGDGGERRTASERVLELEQVRLALGAADAEILMTDEQRHMRLDTVPRRDLTALIEREARLSICSLRPDIVLLPFASYNQDHEAVLRAGLTACRPHDPAALPSPPVVLLYEYPPNSWMLPQERFVPNCYVDATDFLDRKLEVYGLYKSQIRTGVHQNSPDNVRHLALLRGKEVGVGAAEAFQTMRFLL